MTLRSYAIGDIHGQIDLLREAHRWIQEDRARTKDMESPVIHLGDLVDRGPDSAGVVDLLLQGQILGRPWVVLKGNHDRMFSLYLEGSRDPILRADATWLHPRLGGQQTLASYGLDPEAPPERARAAVPETHRRFLEDLPTYWHRGAVVFVHAGLRPGVALADQSADDLLWIRDPFLNHGAAYPWLVLHGHTHLPAPRHHGNRVNIDSGAAYGGPLTAVVIEGQAVFTLGPEGRTPLLPGAD